MTRHIVFITFAIALLSSCVLGQPPVRVSLEPRTYTASERERVEVKLVIVFGSQLIYGGVFNVTYPPGSANVTVKGSGNWTVFQETVGGRRYYVFYRNPGTSVSDPSTLATLTIEVRPGATSFTLNLTHFEAAGASGNDLSIVYENQRVDVRIMSRGVDWRLISIVAAAAAVAAVAVAAVYYVYAQPAIHLLIERRALRLRSSRIVRPKSAGNVPEKITVESSGKRESKTELLREEEHLLPPFEVMKERYVGKAIGVELPEVTSLKLLSLRVHDYECRSLLSKTRISATLLCVDEEGRSHVLKVPVEFYDWKVHGEPLGRGTMYRRFGKEVEVMSEVARLGHHCIVKFEKALEAHGDDPPALVFEFCEGGSLADLLQKRGKLEPVTAVKIVVQIADALAAIHELGYAHGDVKPENILFSRDRIPRLADFNSARAVAVVSHSEVPFTYGYAAPEQLASRRPSQKGDVWSLALVLYEAATGRSLFPLDDVGYQEAVARLERGGSVEIRTGDGDLDAIIEKCIKVKPDERPSMRDFENMLFEYLEKRRKI
jgi:serine/threonine protein kinase